MTYLPVSLFLKDSHGRNAFTYITIVASAENLTGIWHKNLYTTARTEIIPPFSLFPYLSRTLMVGMHVLTIVASTDEIIRVVPKNPL